MLRCVVVCVFFVMTWHPPISTLPDTLLPYTTLSRSRRVAEPPAPVRFVLRVVALEPLDVAVALEREDVGRDPVEEPAIVADHHRAAGEVEQRILECAPRIDIEVVRRLVEQQDVRPGFEHLGSEETKSELRSIRRIS